MAIYFLNLKTFGRSGGSSAVSAAAYRSGERIHDERTGKTYDHADRQDVTHKEIVLPSEFADAEMGWARDRSSLWNAAESAEMRKNARVAREYLVALPVELSPEQRLKLVRVFSQELSDRYGFALDFTIHAPRDFPDSDPRNFHAHLLATTREVTPNGLGAKTTLEMHDRQRYVRGLGSSIKELVHVRERWANVTNEALREAHIDARIDHRTLAAQGIDREPRPQIPKAAFEMERHGYRNELAERLREEYRVRVEARLEKSAARERAAAAEPAAREVAAKAPPAKELADNQPAARESATAQVDLANRTARPQSLEDIRREARENWLRVRQSQGYGQGQTREQAQGQAQSATAKTGHGRDDDFTR